MQCYNAGLIAKGFQQLLGVNYTNIFCSVMKLATIRVILCVAFSQNQPLWQLDINNGFLHGSLTEEVYMSQPLGFVDSNNPSYVCKPNFKGFPSLLWIQNSCADTSLFIYHQQGCTMYLLVYVNDIVLTGSDPLLLNQFFSSLFAQFSINDLGDLHYFLRIEVCPLALGLFLLNRSIYSTFQIRQKWPLLMVQLP